MGLALNSYLNQDPAGFYKGTSRSGIWLPSGARTFNACIQPETANQHPLTAITLPGATTSKLRRGPQ